MQSPHGVVLYVLRQFLTSAAGCLRVWELWEQVESSFWIAVRVRIYWTFLRVSRVSYDCWELWDFREFREFRDFIDSIRNCSIWELGGRLKTENWPHLTPFSREFAEVFEALSVGECLYGFCESLLQPSLFHIIWSFYVFSTCFFTIVRLVGECSWCLRGCCVWFPLETAALVLKVAGKNLHASNFVEWWSRVFHQNGSGTAWRLIQASSVFNFVFMRVFERLQVLHALQAALLRILRKLWKQL